MRFALHLAVTILASAAFAQTVAPKPHPTQTIWEPPEWNFPENTKSTVPNEMLSMLYVSGYRITLEETPIEDVRKRFGGEIGQKGDAGDFLEWLCFNGEDATGAWVLWLESGEIDGGSVGSFQWQRLSKHEVLAPGCHTLPTPSIKLPLPLKLGARKADALRVLGQPTASDAGRLVYLHEHESTIRGEPFSTSNLVVVRLRKGMIWAIQASKMTVS